MHKELDKLNRPSSLGLEFGIRWLFTTTTTTSGSGGSGGSREGERSWQNEKNV